MVDASSTFGGRLGVQQRVLPGYRTPFFELLAQACDDGLAIFAGQPLANEAIGVADEVRGAFFYNARNRHYFDPSSSLYFCRQTNLIEWLEDWRPGALILEANPRYLATSDAVEWMHARGCPVLGWGLGAPFSRKLGWLLNPLWTRFLKQFDALIAYSQRGAQQYIARGMPEKRVFVAHNAAVPRPAHEPITRPLDFNRPPCLLFVGRLQARKRIDNLLHACAAHPAGFEPHLIIVGDGPERQGLETLAAQVYPRAEFVGAHSGAALEPFWAAADLFILPGTGGLAVQQAMAYGLPVIVAKGDGTQDDLVHPENGWQIPPDDLPALIDTLGNALSNVNRLRMMGTESFRIVKDEINLEKMVDVFVEAINSI